MKFTKYLIIALAAVIILSVSSAALAAFNLQGSVTHAKISYQVIVDSKIQGSVISLTGSVTNQGNAASGITVVFYQSDTTGNMIMAPGTNTPLWSSTAVSDVNGVAPATYDAAGNIDAYFSAYAIIK